MTIVDAQRLLKSRPYFAAQMVEQGMQTVSWEESVEITPMSYGHV